MKKILTAVVVLILCVPLFCFEASAQQTVQDIQDIKSADSANSWRYENGEIVTDIYAASLLADDPYHPDATLKGIDVSKHQGVIDWEKVKEAGIDFAIIRCGYAEDKTEYDDTRWEYNASECERLGIPYGVYLYSYAFNVAEAKSEADHVLRLLKGHSPSLPVYYDMEDNSTLPYDHAAMAKAFCKKISDAGYPVGVYASLYWWNTYLTDPCFDNWYRWVAQWGSSCTYDGDYALWQYTSTGRVDGISTNVDMNYLIGYPDDHGVQPWTQLKVTAASNGAPKLSWKAADGAVSYKVYSSTQKNGGYTAVDVTGTSYTDKDAKPGTTCYYKVMAVYTGGKVSGYSNTVQIAVKLKAPSAKIGNDESTGKPILSWNSVRCAEKYQIYRKTGSGGTYELQATTTKTSLTDTSAEAGLTYYYKVRAVYGSVKSSYSSEISTICDLPEVTIKSLAISADDKINIIWNPVPNAAGYSIYRSTSEDGEYTFVRKTMSAKYAGLAEQDGKTLWYKIVANHSNSQADGAASKAVSLFGNSDGITLSITGVSAVGREKFSWQKVSGASVYEIYCSDRKNGRYTLIGTTGGTSYLNAAAAEGKTCYYKIRAIRYKNDVRQLLASSMFGN